MLPGCVCGSKVLTRISFTSKWEDKCLKAYGNELMYAGIPVDRDYCNKTNGDFHSVLYTIEAED